jgi:hypothetical protein
MLRRYGREALRHCIISHTESVSDLLEVLVLLKETGLVQGTLDDARDHRADRLAAVRDHRRPAQRRRRSCASTTRCPASPR